MIFWCARSIALCQGGIVKVLDGMGGDNFEL